MNIRYANERGSANFGWLDSRHTFSFGHYYDAKHMGHGVLRVINEDVVRGGEGFPPHGHADMEIISYVIRGALEHKDSNGNSSVIHPGEVQRMSAGQGIRHSEYNASDSEDVHFLQIWIEPDTRGIPSGYEQKAFPALQNAADKLTLLASSDGAEGSITIQQNVKLYGGKLKDNIELNHQLDDDRIGWLQVVSGELMVNGQKISTGDGVAFTKGEEVHISRTLNAEVLLFDMVE